MKRNKLYYILFVLYILATAFVLYVNGIFTGNVASFLNLAINGVFLLVIGILFVICGFSFARLNRCTDELVRVTGSGGANGIATFCNTVIMMQHQKRRFMEHVDYITSCGWMDGPGGRERAGLPGNRGPQMVVTDLGIMKFDEETKRMYLAYYYPFSSPEMVQENTGFEIDVTRAELMEGPDPEIIRLIREEIDPGQAFIKVPKENK